MNINNNNEHVIKIKNKIVNYDIDDNGIYLLTEHSLICNWNMLKSKFTSYLCIITQTYLSLYSQTVKCLSRVSIDYYFGSFYLYCECSIIWNTFNGW